MVAMTADDPVPTLVLAGGASRRMGTDKRLALIDGVPMLRRTLDRLAATPCLVVFDPHDPPRIAMPDHARLVADTRPGEGPLAAIEAGLLATDAPVVGVVAADTPWVEPEVLALLARALAIDPSAPMACLEDDQGTPPLPLALRRGATLALVTRLLDQGERRLRALLPHARAVESAVWRKVDPEGRSLRDVDTPRDLVAT